MKTPGPAPAVLLLLGFTMISARAADRLIGDRQTAPASPHAISAPDSPSPAGTREINPAIARAAEWLATIPEEDLRFDAAVGLWHLRQDFRSSALDLAWTRAVKVADRDDDNPLRRLWDATAMAPAGMTAGWEVPAGRAARVNTNRVIIEALHCAGNGWRPETSRYVEGPMRDTGGFHSTHALWAIHLAYLNGCAAEIDYRRIATALQEELRKNQPRAFQPGSTQEIDLYGERILMLILTRDTGPPVAQWIARLMSLQGDDGSWGIDRAGEDPYYRYHATMVAAWALAAWSAAG